MERDNKGRFVSATKAPPVAPSVSGPMLPRPSIDTTYRTPIGFGWYCATLLVVFAIACVLAYASNECFNVQVSCRTLIDLVTGR